MAKFAYDVNTRQRLIDIHKQFKGGLKTVDTDDALGSVFLRQAENISLSEFGFIEKRYGTYENFKAGLPVTETSKLQGYWEFLGKYIIIALDGKLYYQLLTSPESSYTEFTQFYTEENLIYPTELATYLGLESDFSTGSGWTGFQKTREMGAINVANVLYIFTGTYPIYIYEKTITDTQANTSSIELRAYLFSKETPTYPEIAVTGHNLLEDDYEALYFSAITDPEAIAFLSEENGNTKEDIEKQLVIKDATFAPSIAFVKDGELEFRMSYDYDYNLEEPFDVDRTIESSDTARTRLAPTYLNTIEMTKVEGRPSGPGATDLSFTPFALSDVKFNEINNVPENLNTDIEIVAGSITANNVALSGVLINNAGNTTVGTETTLSLKEKYWAIAADSRQALLPTKTVFGLSKLQQVDKTIGDTELLNIKYKEFEIDINNISDATDFSGSSTGKNKVVEFEIYNTATNNTINIEEPLQKALQALTTYAAQDNRTFTIETAVRPFYGGSQYQGKDWRVFARFDTELFPIFWFRDDFTREATADLSQGQLTGTPLHKDYTGYEKIEVDIVDTDPFGTEQGFVVSLYEGELVGGAAAGTPLINYTLWYSDTIYYRPDINENQDIKTLTPAELRQALPKTREETAAIVAAKRVLGKKTRIELYTHDGNTDDLYAVYTVGVDPEVEFTNGKYRLSLDVDLPSASHYRLKIKSTVVQTTIGSQTTFLQRDKDDTYSLGGEAEPRKLFGDDKIKTNSFRIDYEDIDYFRPIYLYPNIPQFTAMPVLLYRGVTSNETSFDLRPVKTLLDLDTQFDDFGTLLNVKLSSGLLAGTYDFRFTYTLKQKRFNYNTYEVNDVVSKPDREVSFIVKSVPITEEKLQDYEFFQDEEGNPKHPIWSCNKVIEHFGKLMVYGSEEMPSSIFYSFPDRPFYFPSKFFLDFTNEENLPVTSIAPYSKILVVQTETQTWGLKGNSGLIDAPSPYVPFTINSTVGALAPKSVRPVRNRLFFLSRQGIVALNSLYAVDDTYNIDFVDRNIKNIVPQDKDAIGIQFDNQYWLNFPESSITLRWYIDKKAWVQDKYQGWSDLNGVFKYQIRNGYLEFITHPSNYDSGYGLYKIGVDYDLPTDLKAAVVAKFETSFLNQNYPFHPKNYKEAKLDFTLQNEYNLSGDAIDVMDTNENITFSPTFTNSVHIINDAAGKANHFYKLTYDFSPQYNEIDGGSYELVDGYELDGGDFSTNTYATIGNLTYTVITTLDAGDFGTALSNVYDGGSYNSPPTDIIDGFAFSLLNPVDETFDHLVIESVQVREFDTDTVYQSIPFTVTEETITFQVPNTIKGNKFDVYVFGNFENYIAGSTLYDVTYDDSLTFKTWVVSEDQTLNLDNINSYDQAKADVEFNFNDRLGTWVFGSSDFGKSVTAVRTIKLSGKGYNSKIYMEDYSKSKWTLESMGITYKMKRARSR